MHAAKSCGDRLSQRARGKKDSRTKYIGAKQRSSPVEAVHLSMSIGAVLLIIMGVFEATHL